MKVFQTAHKYSPHIPLFEKKYGIADDLNISFEELRRLIVEDGYASAYILKPALEHDTENFFYTLWDYDRLQLLWAREHGLETNDLAEIKLAQLQWFQPDVFYNMSPVADNNFIELLKIRGIKCKTICWNGFIEQRPRTFPLYDMHLTLHKPFVEYWHKLNLQAIEFQPAIPDNWVNNVKERPIDVLFYGQYADFIFKERNRLVNQLLEFSRKNRKYNIKVHLQYKKTSADLLRIYRCSFKKTVYPSRLIRNHSLPPLYGGDLYEAISKAKIVINAYGDYNREYKSNLRVFEAIGHGAFLISECGNYPDGLSPDIDFYTYSSFGELTEKIKFVLSRWPEHKVKAQVASEKIRSIFSKDSQWEQFKKIVSQINA